ncbi:MAG TPA: hypothetical protein VFG15_06175 [Amycolatopsis sp.]|nr:hypothetical protein [Amycolatopsis sp.]
MPDAPKTQHRSVRIADDDWSDLGDAAAAVGLDRAKAINQMIGWFLRRPGIKLPARPPTKPIEETDR